MRSMGWLLASSVCLQFGTGGLWAETPVEVGWIAALQGEPADFSLRRAESEVRSLALLAPLFEGDILEVRGSEASLVVELGEATRITVCHPSNAATVCGARSPYRVPRVGSCPSVATNLTRWIGDWLTRWQDQRRRATVVSAVVRGEEILLPLLDDGGSSLVAGSRSLELAWFGGTPPFDLRVLGPRAEVVAFLAGLETRRARLEEFRWMPGAYTVEVVDGRRRTVRIGFRVVAADNLPVFPPEYAVSETPSALRELLRSAWLAGQDRGRWLLEAYQRTSAAPADDPLALVLRDALEHGEWPAPE